MCRLVNIQNNSQECLKFCLLHHRIEKKSNYMVSVLYKIADIYSFENIAFPVSYEDIDIFQSLNKICVMAYKLDHEDILVLSKQGDYKYILKNIVYL